MMAADVVAVIGGHATDHQDGGSLAGDFLDDDEGIVELAAPGYAEDAKATQLVAEGEAADGEDLCSRRRRRAQQHPDPECRGHPPRAFRTAARAVGEAGGNTCEPRGGPDH